MAERFDDMYSSLYGEEGYKLVEGVSNFKYLGRPLHQTDNDGPVVRRKSMRARLVWGRLVNIIIWEGADPKVSELFYREVIKEVLLFGAENWVLLAAMERKVEGTHTVFL